MEIPGALQGVAPQVFDKFATAYRNVKDCREKVTAMNGKMTDLRASSNDLKRRVDSYETSGMRRTEEVENWLSTVETLERKTKDVQEEYSKHRWNPFRRCGITKKSVNLTTEAEKMELRARDFSVVADDRYLVHFVETPLDPIVGREDLLEEFLELIRGSEHDIVGIHGMSGVGKTAVVKHFNNEFLKAICEDRKMVAIYIDVPDHGDPIKSIQEFICERLKILPENSDTVDKAARLIREALGRWDYVLILDGLTKPLDFHKIGIPSSVNANFRRKIIVTARTKSVCDQMGIRRTLKVDVLTSGSSRRLFEHAGNHNVTPDIEDFAKQILEICGGLPTAIINMSREIAGALTGNDWKQASNDIRYAPWNLQGMEENVLAPLRRSSYDKLPDQKTKDCLLYFSLFDGKSIDKHRIRACLTAERYFGDLFYIEVLSKAEEMFNHLMRASLLERGDSEGQFKMNPIIRAMAIWIAYKETGNESAFFVRSNVGLNEAPGAKLWSGAVLMSLAGNEIAKLDSGLPCNSLTSLLLHENRRLKKIHQDFFQIMPALRVLDLSHTEIQELPSSIQCLVQLEYLNLSSTRLRCLPEELRKLVKLRILWVRDMPYLRMIPRGVIRNLTGLESLEMDGGYGDWTTGEQNNTNDVPLEELMFLDRLSELGITIKLFNVMGMASWSVQLARLIVSLELKSCVGLRSIGQLHEIGGWQGMTKLESLKIVGCEDLQDVVLVDASSLKQLELIDLPILKTVEIIRCSELKKLELRNAGNLTTIRGTLEWWHALELSRERRQELVLTFDPYGVA